MKSLRLSLIAVVILTLVSLPTIRAQDLPGALVSFGNFNHARVEISLEMTSGLAYDNLAPNITTSYAPVDPGEYTVEYAYSGDTPPASTPILPDTVNLEAGHHYTIIKGDYDRPALVIDRTTLFEEFLLAQGENSLIVVSETVVDDESAAENFSLTSPTGDPLPIHGYQGYFLGIITQEGATLERRDPQLGSTVDEIKIEGLPSITVVINGDWVPDEEVAPVPNYSTTLNVAEWLAAFNQMTAPPFTFNNFIQTATSGGFLAALNECQDYMWNVFTDAAYEALPAEEQATVTTNAAVVMDASVLQPATTMPWLISPTATRGGTPLTYANPFATPAAPDPNAIMGNVILTVSTAGNGVQNVVHIVDNVPTNYQAPRSYRLYRGFRF